MNVNKDSMIMAIETSCDDTGIALLTKDKQLIFNEIISSQKEHQKYGGIVPEVAARAHEFNLPLLIEKVKVMDGDIMKKIRYVAYTETPGLPGSLHIGKVAAKLLAKESNSELIPVNHLYGRCV